MLLTSSFKHRPFFHPSCEYVKSVQLSSWALSCAVVVNVRSVSFPFYKSKAWRNCRAAYLRSVSGLCEECMKQGIVKPADIVHHKIVLDDEKAKDPEIALNFENLQAVCIDCHNKIHYSKAQPKRYKIVDGELVIVGDAPP